MAMKLVREGKKTEYKQENGQIHYGCSTRGLPTNIL